MWNVAPYTGAWIEIMYPSTMLQNPLPSHPTRVRGLKSEGDIEKLIIEMSHPTRVRGLKYSVLAVCYHLLGRTLHGCVDWNKYFVIPIDLEQGSHPTRVRGLKLGISTKMTKMLMSHPTRVRGLKYKLSYYLMIALCRTLHGCVDWNMLGERMTGIVVRRTLHGCVDWNLWPLRCRCK